MSRVCVPPRRGAGFKSLRVLPVSGSALQGLPAWKDRSSAPAPEPAPARTTWELVRNPESRNLIPTCQMGFDRISRNS